MTKTISFLLILSAILLGVLCPSCSHSVSNSTIEKPMKVEKTLFPTSTKMNKFMLEENAWENGANGVSIGFSLDLPSDFETKNPNAKYEIIYKVLPNNKTLIADTFFTKLSGYKKIFVPFHQLAALNKGSNIIRLEIRGSVYFPADSVRQEVRKFDAQVLVSSVFQMPEILSNALVLEKLQTDTTKYDPSQMDFSVLWGSGYPDIFWEAYLGNYKIFTSLSCKNSVDYCRKDTTPIFNYVSGDTLRVLVCDFDAISNHDIISLFSFPISDLKTPSRQFLRFDKIKIMHIRPL